MIGAQNPDTPTKIQLAANATPSFFNPTIDAIIVGKVNQIVPIMEPTIKAKAIAVAKLRQGIHMHQQNIATNQDTIIVTLVGPIMSPILPTDGLPYMIPTATHVETVDASVDE